MNIKIDYEDELEKIEDEHIKKMLEVTFSKILPGIIANCENENIAAKMMISLQEMLGDFSKFGIETLQIENYFIGNTYTKYCNDLVNVIDIIPADCKKQTFHIFDQVLNNTILVLINDGLVNGSITVEELSYEQGNNEINENMENLQITQVNDFVDNTGLSFVKEGEKGEIYYYVDGEPSGWGTAFEHFSKFPADK